MLRVELWVDAAMEEAGARSALRIYRKQKARAAVTGAGRISPYRISPFTALARDLQG